MKRSLQRSGKTCLALLAAGLLVVTLVALVACSSSGTKTTPTPTATSTGIVNKVSIEGFAFNPSSLTVPVGTTVTWTNNDSVTHTVTSVVLPK